MASPDQYAVYETEDDKVKEYEARVVRAEKAIEELRPEVEKAWSRYRDDASPESVVPNGYTVTPVDGIGVIDTMFSALTAVDVDFTVTARHGTRLEARLAEAALSNEMRVLRVNRRAGPAIKDAIMARAGFARVGYEYAEEQQMVPRSDEALTNDVKAIMVGAAAAGERQPTPDEIAQIVPTEEEQTVVTKDRIVLDYVPWDHMLFDPKARRWEDLRWVGHFTDLPVREVRENAAFQDYAKNKRGHSKALKELGPSNTAWESTGPKSVEDETVRVYEMADLTTGTICTFAKGYKYLLDERPNLFALFPDLEDRNPYVHYVERLDGEHVRGIGDAKVIEGSMKELQLYRSRLATYLDRTIGKVIGPDRAMTDAGKKALKSREWNEYVALNEGFDANQVQGLQIPSLPQELFNVPEKVQQSLLEATGANEIQRGLFAPRRTTATEVRQVADQSGVRAAEKQNGLQAFYEDIAKRVLTLMQLVYDAPRITQLVEHEAEVQWEWSRQDIVIGADIEVHLTPAKTDTQDDRTQNAVMWFNLLAPLGAQGGPINLANLVLWGLQESGFRAEDIAAIVNTPEQQQQDQAQALQGQAAEAAAQAQGQAAGAAAGAPPPGGLNPNVAASLASVPGRPVSPADYANEQVIVRQ